MIGLQSVNWFKV